jgi:hypothetical protein
MIEELGPLLSASDQMYWKTQRLLWMVMRREQSSNSHQLQDNHRCSSTTRFTGSQKLHIAILSVWFPWDGDFSPARGYFVKLFLWSR